MTWGAIAISAVTTGTLVYIALRWGERIERREEARRLLTSFQNHAAKCEQCARARTVQGMCSVGAWVSEEAWRRGGLRP